MYVFSRSSSDEDDEEALKWAALEKPRLIIASGTAPMKWKLEISDWRIRGIWLRDWLPASKIITKIFFSDSRSELIAIVGIDIPTIEVRYEHLNINAEAYNASRSLPTFVNFNIKIIKGILNTLYSLPIRKKPFTTLKDVSGIIKPCRMTLLLGPPTSGKNNSSACFGRKT